MLALLFIAELDMEIKLLSRVISPFEEEVKLQTEKFHQTKNKYSLLYKKKSQLNESNKNLMINIEVTIIIFFVVVVLYDDEKV